MNKGHNLIIIGSEEWWESNGTCPRGASLARTFSQHPKIEKVLIVNCPRSLIGRLKNKLRKEKDIETIYPVTLKKRGLSVMRLNPKLFMLNTTTFLPEFDNPISTNERADLAKKMSLLIKEFGFDNSILWILNPRITDIARKIPFKLRIFDTIDNLLLHHLTQKFYYKIKEAYAWVESNADLICILCENQKDMFLNKEKMFLLPNGVDNSFFADTLIRPSDIENICSPVVLYVGILQDRIDINLMLQVVKLLPDHQFVFIGPEILKGYFDILKLQPNVHFLGIRKHDLIPSYIKYSDVCIIPHKINKFTDSQNPLKIYEYLAAGKPIVSTSIAGTENFKDYIYIANEPVSFASAIKQAIAENSGILEKERIKAASINSWNSRVDRVMTKIDELLQK